MSIIFAFSIILAVALCLLMKARKPSSRAMPRSHWLLSHTMPTDVMPSRSGMNQIQ
jgi:hypothetical protein